ncbi:hypothetical protein DPEC_G00171450 [Dallia pectoralis]|uniref:Uncharacterized protein n=1 Tax=Dallia pectoralis TaxID=75939 RepID=A0ACC2GDQ2_DALPE|nr:hypothetical protein DPEC_G00171450 [Dallia pectoralis]
MVILLNCVTLGMYQPCERVKSTTDRSELLEKFDEFIFAFFALEMLVKMLALGIFGRRCYLGDTWNRLDFLIVMAGLLEYMLVDNKNINLTAIRTVRVLRPLKAINRVPSMRILVNLLLDTLPMLGNVLLICFFVFFIFGIVGVQLWAGKLRNRCYHENKTFNSGIALNHTYYMVDAEDNRPFVCSLEEDSGVLTCSDVPARRQGNNTCCLNKTNVTQLFGPSNGSGHCVNWNEYYTQCRAGDKNPHKGAISFDNIARAWIVIFQVITLEGWVEIMYYVINAHSFFNFIYFILLIIIGSFFMINLCLVVVASQFSETKQREHQLMEEQRTQAHSCSTLDGMTEPSASCYESIFQLVLHVFRKAFRMSKALVNRLLGRPKEVARTLRRGGENANMNGGGRGENKQATPCPHHSKPRPPGDPLTLTVSYTTNGCPRCRGSKVRTADEEAVDEDDRKGDSGGCRRWCGKLWRKIRSKLSGIANSKYFNRGILVAILINSISMGIEHHNQPMELTNIIEISNIVFTSMFALEMVLKITAFGCMMYLKFPYNVLDGIIVIISVWEIMVVGEGGLSVLRTFRLLRVAKLIRFMPALRRQLVVLMKTVDSVATFCMLLMLFIFTFSILGMHIFGCKFTQKTETGDTVPDRKNFDSLLWAIVTVFQILTQEDWNVVLYNGMAATSPVAALYFVALMTFGNYVLFNLLVAILVEGYQAEGDANCSFSDDDSSQSNVIEKLNDSLKLSDDKTTPDHMELTQLTPAITPTGSFSLGSRKSSMMSVGVASLGQRRSFSLRHGRSSVYHNWGRPPIQSAWSRRSSWNSVGHPSRSLGRMEAGVLGGSLRGQTPNPGSPYDPDERRSLLTDPRHASPLSLLSPGCSSRRTVSLELPDTLQVPQGDPTRPEPRKRSVSGGEGSGVGVKRHDCNGKMPVPVSPEVLSLAEVYPQLNITKDKPDLDEDTLCFRIRTVLEVYRPACCERRTDWSIYLFSPQNEFRLMCQSIISHKLFDCVILAFIFLNCITVAVERPKIVPDSWERLVLNISNYGFTVIFVAEMSIKVVSQGLYLGEKAYLKSSWNILDGFLVFISLLDIMVSMVAEAKILGVLRVLRLLRTLRPLRVISRFPGLRLVVETLITSLKPIGNIVLICCAFFLIFGILGVQFFKGKFYHCVGKDVRNITNKTGCLQANYQWINQKYNFDNLGKALMSLFVVASKDGWVEIMYQGLDAVGLDQQPIINYRQSMLLYFISFLLIVSFFVLNMFVGVVVENFQKCRQNQEEEEAKRMEEKRQRRMEKKRRKAQKIPYYAKYTHTRRVIHRVCTSNHLDLFITFIICVNVITMSADHYQSPKSLDAALEYCNYFFTAIFVVEALLKLIAFGFQRFFKDRWNLLDLSIVVLSVMGIVLEKFLPINPTIIRIMRVLRIARVLKLLKIAEGMRALLHTVVQALPQVGNLGLLFVLLFFIYAALGVELFGRMVFNAEHQCEGMGPHASFEHFGMALLTLFQVSTGDNWNSIMKDTLSDCPSGLSDYHCQPGFQFIYTIYFVSFVLTAQFVLMNVVVAVLMKHLDDSNKVAQENIEMDAEIELELAKGKLQLASCCMGKLAMGVVLAGIGPSSGDGGVDGRPSGGRQRVTGAQEGYSEEAPANRGGERHDGQRRHHKGNHYSPAQVSD